MEHSCPSQGRRQGVSLYALRHIVATEQLVAGADVAVAAANLGHARPQITLQAYARPLPKAQRSSTVAVGAIWCKKDE
jgi:site-specific recombinase XerD